MEEKNVLLGVPNSENDPVHHPSYYGDGGMECIEEMLVVFGLEATINFCKLCSWKYRKRAGMKPGNSAEQDRAKADWYIAKAKELQKGWSRNVDFI